MASTNSNAAVATIGAAVVGAGAMYFCTRLSAPAGFTGTLVLTYLDAKFAAEPIRLVSSPNIACHERV